MTFEEVKSRIASGIAPVSLEEITSDIAVLTEGASDVEQSIAIRLYESQLLRGRKGWCAWAMDTFGYYDDGATYYRRCAVGEMLWLLRKEEKCLFKKHLFTRITFLEALLPLLHDEKRGFAGLVNFLKLHWRDDWSRERLMAERDRFLDVKSKPVQLAFDFDGLQAQSGDKIAAFIEEKQLEPGQAGVLVRNGVMLCTAALPYMTAHPETFDDEDVPYLEEMRDHLEDAARELAKLIASKNRKVLGV